MKLVTFCFLFFLSSFASTGQTLTTVGTDFWLGFMHNTGSSNEELRLFITSQTATSGSVSIPLLGWTTNFSVAPNVTTTVIVPLAQGETVTNDVVDVRGVHVVTNDPVSLFAINFSLFSADASKILPATSLGTEYVVSAYRGIFNFSRSECLIVATQDNTEIEIIPSVATWGGHLPGIPYLITLDEGETYQLKANSTSEDLTGTKLTGTLQSGSCRPFAVFGGAECANVPTNCTTCDHLFDQQFPIYAWGTEYYMPPFQTTGVYTYRVLALNNGTQISVDGGAPQNLNAGQIIEVNNEANPKQITSNQPIQVIQLMQGDNCSQNGDPAMLVLNPNDQKISNVTFSTVSSNVITNHYLNIVVESSNVGTVLLDNTPIPGGNFVPFPTNPLNSYAQIPVTQGSHNLFASNGFTGYLYGMGTAESYAYSLGSFKEEVVIPVDSVLCTSTGVTLTPPISLFTPEWYAMSDSSNVLSTTNSLVISAPVITDLYTVNGISPLSGCPESYTFSISGFTSPTIDISVDEDTVCIFNTISAIANVADTGFFEYSWWPSYAFSDPTNDTTEITASFSGWYGVTVSNVGGGCAEASDSVYIHVEPSNIESLTIHASDSLLCLGETGTLNAEVNEILFFEEFNGTAPSPLWNSAVGGVIDNVCGSISGSAFLFNTGPTREAITQDFDVSLGGEIQFYLKVANGTAPCDDAELGENILLEYSTNGGANWTLISTLFEFNYPVATLISLPIPAAAQTPNTRFRISQPVFSGINEDVWWIDNVIVTAVSNNSALQYSWTPTQFLSSPNAANTDVTPTSSQWYTLEVGTGNCIYDDSVFIEVSDTISLELLQDTLVCGSQAVPFEAVISGSQNYQITWGPPNVYSSINGVYATVLPGTDTTLYVTVDSPNGCFSKTDSVQMQSVIMDVSINGASYMCLDWPQTLNASVSGNVNSYTVNWFENGIPINNSQLSLNINPPANTTYSIEIIDQVSGCSATDVFSVNVTNLNVDAGADTTLCNVFGYQLQGSTSALGYDASWNNPTLLTDPTTLNPNILQNGTYQFILTVTSASCTQIDTVNITYVPASYVYLPEDTTICEGTSFTIPFGNATSISWNNTNGIVSSGTDFTFQPNSNTTYIVYYTTSNGCFALDTMEVLVQNLPEVTLPSDTTICSSSNLIISPLISPPGGAYLWSNGATTQGITVNSAGTYFLNYSNQCGVDSDTIEVFNFASYGFSLGNDTTICPNDQILLQPTIPIGGSLLWDNGTNNTTYLTGPAIVTAIADDGNGCLVSDTIVISASPDIVFDIPDNVSFCLGDSIYLNAQSAQGFGYLWNTGETSTGIFVDQAGTYSVTVTDQWGCQQSDVTVANTLALPSPQITGPIEFCSNEFAQYSVQNQFADYVWSNGGTQNATEISGAVDQISIVVEDFNGCVGVDTLELTPIIVPDLDLGEDIILCDTTSVVLDGTVMNATSYEWSPSGQTAPVIDALPGVYTLLVTYNGCSIRDTIGIAVEPYTLDLGDDQTLCRDDEVALIHPMLNIDSLIWSDGSTGSLYTMSTDYVLEDSITIDVTAYGCDVKQDSVKIYFEQCDCQIYVPNSFTPNGDAINEGFTVYFDCVLESFKLQLFNRWGEIIYETTDENFQWDGMLKNGSFAQQGVYTWKIRYSIEYLGNYNYEEMYGHLNVIR